MKLGGHLSTKDGLKFTALGARALGYNCLQTSLSGEQEWAPLTFSQEEIELYNSMAYGVDTYIHLPYSVNPCEGDRRRRQIFKATYRRFMRIAKSIGTTAAVLHPGYKKQLTERDAMNNLLDFLDDTYDEETNVKLLLETDSGSKNGSAIGSPEFIAEVLETTSRPGTAMCLDTEHMYARGVNLWDPYLREQFLNEYGRIIALVHLNAPDKEVQLGSHLDRHNTPFEAHPECSIELVRELTTDYPCILERSSLAVQKTDMDWIKGTVYKEEQKQEP